MDFVKENVAKSDFILHENHNHSEENHKKSENHNENHDFDLDPHFWTSPEKVKLIVKKICEKIIELDKINEKEYVEKTDIFIKKLDDLHFELSNSLKITEDKPIFTFHNSFGYFIEEFDLNYGGSIEEFSGKESGTKYLTKITEKIKNSKVKAIFSEPQLNQKSVQVIADEIGVNVVELDPIGGFNEKNSNETYFDFVRFNANRIISALE
jgi:zinc transport system substrate-binding protein